MRSRLSQGLALALLAMVVLAGFTLDPVDDLTEAPVSAPESQPITVAEHSSLRPDMSGYIGARGLPKEFIEELEREYGFDEPAYKRFLKMVWSKI